ncbi:MAG: NAD(P)/FAD-dependent oxidoreductase [Planctomycetaceae bacterium]|nr:NAD(P)/FAD-dependent oxidoreductase [Planctomycetaceae bacterium]
MTTKKVVIVGGGFAGLAAAKGLSSSSDVKITLIDKRNHHLFQPLLYQVAMAGLSPADIAAPIRSMLSGQDNACVVQGEVQSVNFDAQTVSVLPIEADASSADADDTAIAETTADNVAWDYLILACGAGHSYFGHDEWEPFAPGLKTLEQATEIRRRVLTAFERAERETDPERRKKQMTFVVVGGGPTGVELAGAIGEMSRHTLARDFRNVDARLARVILVEGGSRILPMFDQQLSSRATRDLEKLGVQVWNSSLVTDVSADGVRIGEEYIEAATVLWAAGVKASPLGERLGLSTDHVGRVCVNADLSVGDHARVFVAGDQACCKTDGKPLAGVAPVAMQQGRYLAKTILRDLQGQPREAFCYHDKGSMATIGRSRAIVQSGDRRITGFFAWWMWLVVHIYYLTGFRNRLFVVMSWAWSYLTWRRGARLIVGKPPESRPS